MVVYSVGLCFGALAALLLVAIAFVAWAVKTAKVESALVVLAEAEGGPDSGRDAIFAASFNPVHAGHIHLLKAIARRHRHGKVVAVVGMNPGKKYAVSPAERVAVLNMILRTDPELRNVEARVVEGYVWRLAFTLDKAKDAAVDATDRGRARKRLRGPLPPPPARCVLYRGVRTWELDGKAEVFLHVLNLVGPVLLGPCKRPPETRFLAAPPPPSPLAVASSTQVRDLVAVHAGAAAFEDEETKAEVRAKLAALVPTPQALDAVLHLYSRSAKGTPHVD